MEALLVDEIPTGEQWQYEPKWDGFRCVAFKDGDHVELQSKAGQSLSRYFPELISALQEIKANKFVIDGEIVIPVGNSFSFDDLLQRIHPAESRIRKLSNEYPAKMIIFDLLVSPDGKSLTARRLSERRPLLEKFFEQNMAGSPILLLFPPTNELKKGQPLLPHARPLPPAAVGETINFDLPSGGQTGD